MLKLILFAVLAQALERIDAFLDNPVRIFLSNSNHEFLVRNVSDNSLIHTSKFAIVKKIYSTFIISKHGNRYVIRSGSQYLCQRGDMGADLCKKEDYWTIIPQTVGYKITKRDKRCLTLEPDSKVTLEPCSIERDQVFDFKIAEEDEKCEEPDIGNYRVRVNPNPQRIKFDVDYQKFLLMMKGFMQTWQTNLLSKFSSNRTASTRQTTLNRGAGGAGKRYASGTETPGNGIDGMPFGTDPHEGAHRPQADSLHEGDHRDELVDPGKINDPHDSILETLHHHEPQEDDKKIKCTTERCNEHNKDHVKCTAGGKPLNVHEMSTKHELAVPQKDLHGHSGLHKGLHVQEMVVPEPPQKSPDWVRL